MPLPVRVYTTRTCAYCLVAKTLLKRRNIAFEEIDVTNDAGKRTWLVQTTGQRTVPQIFIGDQSIGGSQELRALDAQGLLVAMVEGAT